MTISVLLVDDQELIRSGFSMILGAEEDLTIVGEASNGVEAVRRVAELSPDVICMDVQMPQMDGIEATRRIVAADPEARVLILTTFDDDAYLFEALQAGAGGFLLKNCPPDDLVAAIRTVAAGHALLAPEVTQRVIARSTDRTRSVHPGLADLTERETAVLRAMARGSSNAEIAGEMFVSEATVKSHVSHVLSKLQVRDRVQAVIAAHESGLMDDPDTPSPPPAG